MVDLQHRFGGMQRLYGVDAFATIAQANICVVGIGGVGSWVAEALARSGVGKLTLIDMDDVSETNINRQLVALESTLEVA
ncbi:MAG: tRNA cyclic N6-threonylcarbamoyladenosine(37) synthase TcdA, partial [Oceanospirillaceae bacterium]|nr:tRNA cyclic N6-threonylcarbamoyladenosine(37) synthase TcdA [Oceanospirillaceae bacterium]